jgi:Helix-turn-helix domain
MLCLSGSAGQGDAQRATPFPIVSRRAPRRSCRLNLRPGTGIEQVAEQSHGDWTASAISRWETGDRRIRPTDLRALLDITRLAATSAKSC